MAMDNILFKLFGNLFNIVFLVAVGIFKFLYKTTTLICITVIVMSPSYWLISNMKDENPFFIFHFLGAFLWPVIFYWIVLLICNPYKRNAEARNQLNLEDKADAFLNQSKKPFYSPKSDIKTELHDTYERLIKYGSVD